MSTDQAFINAYEKTARQQQVDAGFQAINPPHAPFKSASNGMAPLSELLAQHKRVIENAESQSNETLQIAGSIDTTGRATTQEAMPSNAATLSPQIVVTKFPWPSEVNKLTANLGTTLTGVIDKTISLGAGTLGICSTRRSVGLTTMTLSLARTAINRGARVAMIDLTENQSGIAHQLGFEKIPSLEETVRQGFSLDQAIITSKEEQAFLMLGGKLLPNMATKAIIHRLSNSFDLVLLEAGIAGATERLLDQWLRPVGGASLLVDLASNQLDAPRRAAAEYLGNSEGKFLGVLENLV